MAIPSIDLLLGKSTANLVLRLGFFITIFNLDYSWHLKDQPLSLKQRVQHLKPIKRFVPSSSEACTYKFAIESETYLKKMQ